MPTNLIEEGVQHADAEHSACSEGQAEHEGQVGAFVSLFLRNMKWSENHLTIVQHVVPHSGPRV